MASTTHKVISLPASTGNHCHARGLPSGEDRRLKVFGVGMEEQPSVLGVHVVVGPDDDAGEIAEATIQLSRELLALDVDVVGVPAAGEPPPVSRAADVAAVGDLIVHLANSQLLGAVVGAVGSWLISSQRRSIKLELDGDPLKLTGISSEEQRRLTDEWLARHTNQ